MPLRKKGKIFNSEAHSQKLKADDGIAEEWAVGFCSLVEVYGRKRQKESKCCPNKNPAASTCAPPTLSPSPPPSWVPSGIAVGERRPMMSPLDNTPTPLGLPLPWQQGELLCPGGMCAMTHRLLSPTQRGAAHTHTYTLTVDDWTRSMVHRQNEQSLCGMDCKGGCRCCQGKLGSQHRADPNNACGLLNQWWYWHKWRKWNNKGKNWEKLVHFQTSLQEKNYFYFMSEC